MPSSQSDTQTYSAHADCAHGAVGARLGLFLTPADAAEIRFIHMGERARAPHAAPACARDHSKTEGGLARMYTRSKRSGRSTPTERCCSIPRHHPRLGRGVVHSGPGAGRCAQHFGSTPTRLAIGLGLRHRPCARTVCGLRRESTWHALAANAYYEGEPYADRKGDRPPAAYLVREIDGVKVGHSRLTTDRGPQVVGRGVTKGVRFSKGDAELKEFVTVLREREQVAVVVVISELGLSNTPPGRTGWRAST